MVGAPLAAMGEYLEKASMVLLCVSSTYERSEYCMAEAAMSMYLNKKRLVLIMEDKYDPTKNKTLHPVVSVPMRINCFNANMLDASLIQILREIENAIGQGYDLFHFFLYRT